MLQVEQSSRRAEAPQRRGRHGWAEGGRSPWETAASHLTFTASLYLTHGGQGVGQKVREAAVQIDRGEATLKALPRVDQLRQVSVHLLGHAPDVKVT